MTTCRQLAMFGCFTRLGARPDSFDVYNSLGEKVGWVGNVVGNMGYTAVIHLRNDEVLKLQPSQCKVERNNLENCLKLFRIVLD